MATMTRKRAAEVLRELLGDGDPSEYGQALTIAVRALEPAERKVKAKLSPHVAAFLKMRFADGGTTDGLYLRETGKDYREVTTHENPQLVAQFRYGMRGQSLGNRMPSKAEDAATLAAVLHADRWAA